MDWFYKLIERSEFWSILYILLGFFLGQFGLVFREWFSNRRLERALEDELDTNLHLIDQKQDIVRQMIEALKKGTTLTGESVHSCSVVYEHHYPAIIKRLRPIERDNVRHIYSNLRQLDEWLDNFENEFKGVVSSGLVNDPFTAYQGRLHEINESYDVTKRLIRSYLDGKPKDLYYRGKKQRDKRRIFGGRLRPGNVDELDGE